MNKHKLHFIYGIVLFVASGLLFMYAIWSLTYCAEIISEAKASGQLVVKGNEFDIMSFYMSSSLQYIVFAMLLAVAGLLFQKRTTTADPKAKATIWSNESENDKELDEWFEEESEN